MNDLPPEITKETNKTDCRKVAKEDGCAKTATLLKRPLQTSSHLSFWSSRHSCQLTYHRGRALTRQVIHTYMVHITFTVVVIDSVSRDGTGCACDANMQRVSGWLGTENKGWAVRFNHIVVVSLSLSVCDFWGGRRTPVNKQPAPGFARWT